MRVPSVLAALSALAATPLGACLTDPTTAVADHALVGGTELDEAGATGTDRPASFIVMLEGPPSADVRPPNALPGAPTSCTASRIGRRHFLTATHCLRMFQPGQFLTLLNGAVPTPVTTKFWQRDVRTTWQLPQMQNIGDLRGSDVAIVTVDPRASSYQVLQDIENSVGTHYVDDGLATLAAIDWNDGNVGVAIAGYGCTAYDGSGDARLKYGTARLVEYASPSGVNRNNYFFTEGHRFDPGPTDATTDDRLVGEGVSLCPGDSGGPVLFGGIIGVNSRRHRGADLRNLINSHGIPDVAWVDRVVQAPIIDVTAMSLANLEPHYEWRSATPTHDIYLDQPRFNVLYVKGYHLDSTSFSVGNYPIPVEAVEYLPDDPRDEALGLDTVKITFPTDTPSVRGVLVARSGLDESRPLDEQLPATGRSEIRIHPSPTVRWRRYPMYRALACGEVFGSVTGTCGSDPDMTEVTVVKTSAYDATVDDRSIHLERLEETSTFTAWRATGVVNMTPDRPLDRGVYRYQTVQCNPDGSGCATIYIEYQYQDEEMVEQAGESCRFRRRGFYDIIPWVEVLGFRLDLPSVRDLLPSNGFPGSTGPDVDEAWQPCDEVDEAHPPAHPFTTTPDGDVIPAAGWLQY